MLCSLRRKLACMKLLAVVSAGILAYSTLHTTKRQHKHKYSRLEFLGTKDKASSKLYVNYSATEEKLTDENIDDKQQNENQCLLWTKSNIEGTETEVEPLIKLDPKKLIYPGVIYGPNNQLHGFWQSIYLAIRLNRTLVLPRFLTHYTNGYQWLPAYQRIDVKRLKSFLSTTTREVMMKRCQGSFDVAFQAAAIDFNHLQSTERGAEMKIINVTEKGRSIEPGASLLRMMGEAATSSQQPNIPTFPRSDVRLAWNPWTATDAQSLRSLYNSSAQCAILIAPYKSLKFPESGDLPPPPPARFDFRRASDLDLYATCVDRARAPPFVGQAARDFAREVLNARDYLAVHWRFDEKDWAEWCKKKSRDSEVTAICSDLDNITAGDIAGGVAAELSRNHVALTDWQQVYVAMPPNMLSLREEVYKSFAEINPHLSLIETDVSQFLRARYELCIEQNEWSYVSEIASMVEMALLEGSKWFFFSDVSSWSGNVRAARWQEGADGKRSKKFEASAFLAVKKAMRERLT